MVQKLTPVLRRLAAATGQPMSIRDDTITTKTPGKSPGFTAPDALNVNIRLARVTGQIMDGEEKRDVASNFLDERV